MQSDALDRIYKALADAIPDMQLMLQNETSSLPSQGFTKVRLDS